jgi:RimJ/RimL family protein N-acetyltransferase
VGIGFITGDADAASVTPFLEALAQRTDESLLFEYVSVPDDAWSKKLMSVYAEHAKALERTDYIFDPRKVSLLDERISKGIAGYELRKVDVALADEIKKAYRDFVHVWPHSEDFVRDSLGYCAMHGDLPVAFCYSSFQLTRKILVAVLTRPEHQRKGLASWAAAQLVRDLAASDMECHWTTFATNIGSRSVAGKLGFQNETQHWWVQYKS